MHGSGRKCRCPRQCCHLVYHYTIWFTTTPSDVPLHHLLYHYTISQAQISDFQMLFVKDVYKLNYTIDQLRSEQCVLEVIVNVLIKQNLKCSKNKWTLKLTEVGVLD